MTESPRHSELPIPDYDHLTVGDVESRLRTLDADQLAVIMTYEREHAARPQVLIIAENRLLELAGGAPPTGGAPDAAQPEHAPPAAGAGPVTPQTAGPKVNPPSHGTPQNPAQPRTTG